MGMRMGTTTPDHVRGSLSAQPVPTERPGSSQQPPPQQLYCTEAIDLDSGKDLIYSGNLSSKYLPWRNKPV